MIRPILYMVWCMLKHFPYQEEIKSTFTPALDWFMRGDPVCGSTQCVLGTPLPLPNT